MPALALDPSTTALVLIDLQNAIVARDTHPHKAADVVARSRQLADAFRAKGMPVIYVHVDLAHMLSLPVDEPNPNTGQAIPDSASQIADAAGMQPGDLQIAKRHWGAFAGTDLQQLLEQRNAETVVLAGIATNMGVESTLRQGTGLGFGFVVVEDACAGLSTELHTFAFEKIFPRLAHVRSTTEVLSAIA
jgi:nicotinamidase-related amidase